MRQTSSGAHSGLGTAFATFRRTFVVAVSVGVSVAMACARPPVERAPVAALAASLPAQNEFRPLREAWEEPDGHSAEVLVQGLERFVAKYPTDPITLRARVCLALLYEDRLEREKAQRVLSELPSLAEGTTRDLATLARARLLRREGKAREAYDLLVPLTGKMVDGRSRAMLGEELTLSAIESQRLFEAVLLADGWIRSTPEEDRAPVLARVASLMKTVAPEVLVATLRTKKTQQGERLVLTLPMRKLMAAQLAEVALARDDVALARWLVHGTGGDVPFVSGASHLEELASRPTGIGQVQGRTLGVLLPSRQLRRQNQAAEVMRGIAWVLGLPRQTPATAQDTRLVTQDTPDESAAYKDRLRDLAAEGASVLIAGMDPATADLALAWAEEQRVPVITLAAPLRTSPGPFGFVLGESRRSQVSALAQALSTEGAEEAAPVLPLESLASEEFQRDMLPLTMTTPGACDAAADDLRIQAFPEKAWRQSGVKAWLVDATPECTDKLLATVRQGLVAMTFGSTPSRVPGGRALQLFTLGAGVFPLGMARRGADDVDALVDRLGGSVDFWTALGRDAAMLASRALATVPADSSEDRQVAQRRRDAVRQALEGVRVGLWTADTQGFSATHRVERSLSVVRLTRGIR